MAFTSQWTWGTINRGVGKLVSGGVLYHRNIWKLVRSRISNDSYSSELGDSATSLDGYNGGVTETISSPLVDGLTFAMTGFDGYIEVSGAGSAGVDGRYVRGDDVSGSPAWYQEGGGTGFQDAIIWGGDGTWRLYNNNINIYDSANCLVTDAPYSANASPWANDGGVLPVPSVGGGGGTWATDGGVWLPTGGLKNSFPIYTQYKTTNFPLGKTNVVWYSLTGATFGLWCSAPTTDTLAQSGGFEDEANVTNYPDGFAVASSGGSDLDGKTLEGQEAWDTNDGLASVGPTQVSLDCTDDDQIYDEQSVGWYKQVQTWEFIDAWTPVLS